MADARDVFLAKAVDSLASAEADVAAGRYDSAANRCYYACYQVAVAALIAAGVNPGSKDGQWSHQAVQSQFIGLLVNRRKLYTSDIRGVLARTLEIRLVGDYAARLVSESEIRGTLRQSQRLVHAIRDREGAAR